MIDECILNAVGSTSTVIAPDIIELIIILRYEKPTAEDVRNAVDKWRNYIITHAKKAGATERSQIVTYENMEKTAEGYSFELQINTKLSCYKSAQKLRSHLVEKLDCDRTTILPLEFHHSREVVTKKREELTNYALHKVKNNAKTTAKQMGVRLGALKSISDVELTESFMNTGPAGDSNELSQVLNKKSKTKIIAASVKATFSILPANS